MDFKEFIEVKGIGFYLDGNYGETGFDVAFQRRVIYEIFCD